MKSWTLYLLVVAIYLMLAANALLSTSFFMDGLIYADIAKNMAHGIGSAWHPTLTPALFPEFYEHPTLAMVLLSGCYRLLGDGVWVPRLYSMLMFAATVLLMLRLWRYAGGTARNGWLPMLLLFLIPTVTFSSYDNMLEVSMAPFVLGSALLVLRGNGCEVRWHRLLCMAAGGLSLAVAFFIKGFTGLYPLALPLIISLVGYGFDGPRRIGRRLLLAAVDTAVMAATLLAACGIVLWLNKDAAAYLSTYLSHQVVGSIATASDGSRFDIIKFFFEKTAIVWSLVAATALILLFGKRLKTYPPPQQTVSLIVILLLLTLCGVLPIMVSLKQRSFYLYTVYPFFAVAVAAWLLPAVESWLSHIGRGVRMVVPVFSVLLFAASCFMVGSHYGKPDHSVTQQDQALIMPLLAVGERVALSDDITTEYLHGYYYRDRWVTFTYDDSLHTCRHLILQDEERYHAEGYDLDYREVPLATQRHKLYEKK